EQALAIIDEAADFDTAAGDESGNGFSMWTRVDRNQDETQARSGMESSTMFKGNAYIDPSSITGADTVVDEKRVTIDFYTDLYIENGLINVAGFALNTLAGSELSLIITDANGHSVILENVQIKDDGSFVIDITLAKLSNLDDGSVTVTAQVFTNGLEQSSSSIIRNLDTTAPNLPGISVDSDVNNDGFVSASEFSNEINITIDLADTSAQAGDILIVNGIEGEITQSDIDNNSQTITVASTSDDQKIDLIITIKDQSGNESEPASLSFTIDTTAPEQADFSVRGAEDNALNAQEISSGAIVDVVLPVGSEIGDVITVKVTNGQQTTDITYTVAANEGAGDVVEVLIPKHVLIPDGEYSVAVQITDAAGNVGEVSQEQSIIVDTLAPGDNAGPDGIDLAPSISVAETADGYINSEELASTTNGKAVPIEITIPNGVSTDDVVRLTITSPDGTNYIVEKQITQQDLETSSITLDLKDIAKLSDSGAEGDYSIVVNMVDPAGNVGKSSENIDFTLDTSVVADVANLDAASDLFLKFDSFEFGSDHDNITSVLFPHFSGELTGEPGSVVHFYVYATLAAHESDSSKYSYESQPFSYTEEAHQVLRDSDTIYTQDNPYLLVSAVVDENGSWKTDSAINALNDSAVNSLNSMSQQNYYLHVVSVVVDAAGNVSDPAEPLIVFMMVGGETQDQKIADPLILDLDGDGVKTIAVSFGVEFDFDGDGNKEIAGWVDPNDGFLVRDINNDGNIEAHELFGDQTSLNGGGNAANGFAALKDMDSDDNNVIDSADSNFSQLQIWQDSNSNGEVDAGELKSLASLNITSINVTGSGTPVIDNGNSIESTSTFTNVTGANNEIADVTLNLALKETDIIDILEEGIVSEAKLDDGIEIRVRVGVDGFLEDLGEGKFIKISIAKEGSDVYTVISAVEIGVDIVAQTYISVDISAANLIGLANGLGFELDGQYNIKIESGIVGNPVFIQVGELGHFTVDTTAPDEASIITTDNDGATDVNIPANGITNDVRPLISGIDGEPGANIDIYGTTGTLLGSTKVGLDGSWSLQPVVDFSEGLNEITVQQTDVAGNVGDVSAPFEFTVDITPPNSTTNDISFINNDNYLTDLEEGVVKFSGSVEENGIVNSITVTDALSGSVTLINDVDFTVDENGNITTIALDLSMLADGELTVTMSVTDEAGNTGEIIDAITKIQGIFVIGDITDTDTKTDTVIANAITGTYVHIDVVATDDDGDVVTYELINNGGGAFTIDSTTGQVSVANNSSLNEGVGVEITIRATSADSSTSEYTTLIAVTGEITSANPIGPVVDIDTNDSNIIAFNA
ncbi:MAG: hypothetical protein HRU25_16110, partial [Psychrobium sp.]|nr:hypothetical protein [Psychrobium sp.]